MTHNDSHSRATPENSRERVSTDREFPWDVFRYVLDDETLDREAFENRMLEDVDLAMQVSAAVKELQVVSAAVESKNVGRACATAVQSQVATSSEFTAQSNRFAVAAWIGALAMAASFLIAVFYTAGFDEFGAGMRSPVLATAGNPDLNLEIVANSWVAIEVQPNPSANPSAQIFAFAQSVDGQPEADESELASDKGKAEDTDWILEAALQFYQENSTSGVPG